MEKYRELYGVWWFPDNPENKIQGKATFVPGDSITLEIFGQFSEFKRSPCFILGEISDGQKITLYDNCISSIDGVNNGSCSRSYYFSNVLLIGKHFEQVETIQFSMIEVGYSNLDEWLHLDTFRDDHMGDAESGVKYSLNYISPRIDLMPIQFDDYKIDIRYSLDYSLHYARGRKIFHSARIQFEPINTQQLSWYEEMTIRFQNYLTLLSGQVSYPTSVVGLTKGETSTCVEVYYINSLCKEGKSDSKRPLVYYFHIKEEFANSVKKWFDEYEKLRPVIELFLGTLYNPRSVATSKFLILTQALEAFHRRKYDGKYLPDEAYEPYCASLCEAIPSSFKNSHRDSLKSRIKYGNEYSLRKRISLLFDQNTSSFLLFIKEKEVFVNAVTNTRNYLTHYDEEIKALAVPGDEIVYLAGKVQIVLLLLLLQCIGISPDICTSNLKQSHEYGYLFDLKNTPMDW